MSAERLTADFRVQVGDLQVDAKFEVPPGVTVLFGPSGAGKSTVLSVLAGVLRPGSGRIACGGEPWFDATTGVDVPPEARSVSIVFQSLALFPHLTALENVEYGLARSMPRAERRERASRMLARMKVAHVEGRRPRTFSGGEAQRVALARAFVRSPRVVLLDEAFSAMDRDLRRELGDDVRAVVDELRVPTLLVTHHRGEARRMGDRAILLRAGRVLEVGALADVVPRDDDD